MTTTTITVNVNVALIWQTGTLTEDQVDNWDAIIGQLNTTVCPFTVSYNNEVYTGFAARSTDNTSILVAFDDPDVIIPAGACMIITCDDGVEEVENHTHCYDNLVTPLTGAERVALLDENGCPIGAVAMTTLALFLFNSLDIPTSLCDLLDVTEIPQGGLVAGDRVLTTSGGCTLKSVPQNEVICP